MTQPPLTPHQSQYVAWLLTRRAAGDTVESLASTLVDSQVDLNPHQVDAALFACRNSLARGVIRQDEVEAQRNDLIGQLEVQLQQQEEERTRFTIEWELT